MFISCDCSIDYDDTYLDVDKTIWRKARKEHECGECSRIIKPGETYELCTTLYDGEWSTHKTCLGCTRIRDHFCAYGWMWGGVAEQVVDCIGYNYTEE